MTRRWRTFAICAALALGAITATPSTSAAAPSPPAPNGAVPPGFHWGVATSGFQSEGSAPDSNWRRYVDAGGSSIKSPYRNSVDFLHRYPGDIALAKKMGLNTFRFGIEWARVMPRPGVFDEKALAFYDDVVRKVEAAGMTPMITLSHFVHPGWIADRGGWAHKSTVAAFLAFSRTVVSRYAGRHILWITFNEPTVYTTHELRNGGITAAESVAMAANLVAAHRSAYDMIHRVDPTAKVSSNLAYLPPPLQAGSDNAFIDRVADKLDFVGVDYYYGLSLDNLTTVHAATGEFWKVAPQPDGIYYALKAYQRKFPSLPLYVVENGMPTDNGKPRADGYTRGDSLDDHVYWMQRAMADGVRVIGYNYWSLTDNYEWGDYRPRFGLYTVDTLTDPKLTRRPTDAVATYRHVVADGGVPNGYLPKRKPAWCAFADLRTCLTPMTTAHR